MRSNLVRTSLACGLAALVFAGCGGGQASIGGTVTGLSSGLTLVLQNNGADSLTLSGTGSSISFTFATDIAAAKTYNVSVLTQPLGQTCTVASGSGTIADPAVDITNVAVTCTTTSSVVGTVSGLSTGVAVTLASNGSTLVAGNGTFAFPGVLAAGSTYSVTVATQPSGQVCTVLNASGTVVANTSAQVTVTCL